MWDRKKLPPGASAGSVPQSSMHQLSQALKQCSRRLDSSLASLCEESDAHAARAISARESLSQARDRHEALLEGGQRLARECELVDGLDALSTHLRTVPPHNESPHSGALAATLSKQVSHDEWPIFPTCHTPFSPYLRI